MKVDAQELKRDSELTPFAVRFAELIEGVDAVSDFRVLMTPQSDVATTWQTTPSMQDTATDMTELA